MDFLNTRVQPWLTAIFLLICVPAMADNTAAGKTFRDCPDCPDMVSIPAGSFDMGLENTSDHFQGIAAEYRSANPKPKLPEEAHKYRVQADFMVKQNQFQQAADLYAKGLELAPWWPQGHYDRGFILGELKQYREAMQEMKRYLALVPNAPDARAVQDQIYQWETVAEPEQESDQDEKPFHQVFIGRAFAIGKTEVTQGQWRAIMGNNNLSHEDDFFDKCGDTCPVVNVSWDNAQVFIQKLNAKTGEQYRLPSEAEWEYACRAGGKQEYCGSDNVDSIAWHSGNSGDTTHPVATKQANAFGLYDMSGNVWEWVEDNWHDNYNGAPTDGSAWQGDDVRRMLRGGSWDDGVQGARAAYRNYNGPGYQGDDTGFRLVRTLP